MDPDVFSNLTYSQLGEDLHIQRILNSRFNKKITDRGFYVDVGAFHPFKFSNTYKFYKNNWRGINIEPNPENFQLFEKYRPLDININMGVSDSSKILKYWKFDRGAFNTFDQNEANALINRNDLTLEKTLSIQTKSLQEIIDNNLPSNQFIDFISIDVEGFDLKVIKSFDIQKFNINIVCIEENMLKYNSYSDSEIYRFLSANDYKLHCIIGKSNLYVKQIP